MSSSSWSSFEDELPDNSKKTLRWLAFGLEAAGGVVITIIALYLRIADLQPEAGLNWREICNNVGLYATQSDDNSALLYAFVTLIPIIFILLGELEYSLFSKKQVFFDLSKSARLLKNLPRMGRIFAMFFIGLMLASFSVDYLKLLIIQPRPYFLTVYGSNCPFPFNGTITDDFYDALKSFPSHLSAVAGFCSMFAICYAHSVRVPRSTPILLPIVSHALILLGVTISLDRYMTHLNHLSDIVVGWLIGIVLAIYMSSLVAFTVRQGTTKEGWNWPNFLEFMIPRVSLPPTTAEAMNVRNIRQMSNV